MGNKVKYLVGILIFIGSLSTTYGQTLSDHVWYYGTQSKGLYFNMTDNLPVQVSFPNSMGTGGGAVATDPWSGKVLFYTNGQTVWDANHQVMPNGTGLTGNPSSNQPAAISAVPGVPDQYYIFTNSATAAAPGSISYSIVDMSQMGNSTTPVPGGVVTSKNLGFAGNLTNVAQGMVIVSNTNCDGFWLIVNESGLANYHALSVDAGGFSNLVTTVGLGLPMEAANISYHKG
ncbi:MAG: hypothetical protein OEY34_03555, partial [Cyclobacteriaceae bacterium]|nr:hypothetical protein [Cyclobacteriaceae bacterium]